MAKPEQVARYLREAEPKLLCARLDSAAAKLQAFQTLGTHKWDRTQMGCAAQYSFELAAAQPANDELFMAALIAQVDYLDLLASEFEGLYQGPTLSTELNLRWGRAKQQAQALLKQAPDSLAQSPEFRIIRAAYWLAASVKQATPQEVAQATRQAMPELDALVREHPQALGGLAVLLMGRLTFALPEFAGGDPLRAIELFKQGIAINPANIVMRRWLVEVYISERDYPSALESINAALKVPVDMTEPQAYADETRALAGLALRAGDETLSQQISTTRQAFLKANPQLLTRVSGASFGHGGADPFTGKEAD
ncbi:tetratricopeptide repeat protein [Pseudomonas veronii]|uniref:tetratricopeptide repeat protein n=1 Tax=Pseudomonas veronii TaxID=76761 RepID=UPI0021C1BC34|nr:hypothetical protein [Pseudomonas veronii]MCT9826656.1 hypothetical protein [Pseudomonas veronii]